MNKITKLAITAAEAVLSKYNSGSITMKKAVSDIDQITKMIRRANSGASPEDFEKAKRHFKKLRSYPFPINGAFHDSIKQIKDIIRGRDYEEIAKKFYPGWTIDDFKILLDQLGVRFTETDEEDDEAEPDVPQEESVDFDTFIEQLLAAQRANADTEK